LKEVIETIILLLCFVPASSLIFALGSVLVSSNKGLYMKGMVGTQMNDKARKSINRQLNKITLPCMFSFGPATLSLFYDKITG